MMQRLPGSSCVRCDWKTPPGLSFPEEDQALWDHLRENHQGWMLDGAQKQEFPNGLPKPQEKPKLEDPKDIEIASLKSKLKQSQAFSIDILEKHVNLINKYIDQGDFKLGANPKEVMICSDTQGLIGLWHIKPDDKIEPHCISQEEFIAKCEVVLNFTSIEGIDALGTALMMARESLLRK